MKGDDKPTANPVVILREEFDDWAILFDPDTGRGFGLSPTAIRLWKLLDGQHTLGTLLQKICHDTDSVPGDAADQITVFIDELVAHGLAGFSETVFGSVNRPFAPEAPRGVKPFPYEPPKLVDFLAHRPAAGKCHDGSQDNGTCNIGHLAGVTCTPNGNAAIGDCNTGYSKGGMCSGGGTPQPGACSGGGAV